MSIQVPFLDLETMTGEVWSEVLGGWTEVVASGRFIGGPVIERFERDWADYCGVAHAVGVANGTDALHLILRALGIGPGDEVVVPGNTFVATAEAVVLAGATPRFADVDPETLLLSPESLRATLSPRTAAVIAVHLFGQMADMRGLGQVAAEAGIALLEDAAQAHGASRDGLRAGAAGLAAGFSFYPGKNLGAFGDAGAVTTSDPQLARKIGLLRDHGRTPGSHYDHSTIGMNSRLDAVQAVVLSAKLKRLDQWNTARRRAMSCYRQGLSGSAVRLVPDAPETTNVHHLAVARTPRRDQVAAALLARGISTGVHYPIPCHQQTPYQQFRHRSLPVCESAALEILSLPMSPSMTEQAIDGVCAALREIVDREVGLNVT